MQSLRNSILNHVRVRVFTTKRLIAGELSALYGDCQQLRTCSTISSNSNDQVMDRVIKLVKKFDKIDAAKVISQVFPDHIFFPSPTANSKDVSCFVTS